MLMMWTCPKNSERFSYVERWSYPSVVFDHSETTRTGADDYSLTEYHSYVYQSNVFTFSRLRHRPTRALKHNRYRTTTIYLSRTQERYRGCCGRSARSIHGVSFTGQNDSCVASEQRERNTSCNTRRTHGYGEQTCI